jgi:hypothetical protein
MSLSWAGGWQAVTMAVALIVGGAAIMAPQAEDSAHLFRWLGYGLLVVGCLVFLASMSLLHRMARRRHRALVVLGRCVSRGDVAWRAQQDGQDPEAVGIEEWRIAVGARLRRAPFVPGAADWVLTQHGNRLDDPLDRLRAMQADVDRWIE